MNISKKTNKKKDSKKTDSRTISVSLVGENSEVVKGIISKWKKQNKNTSAEICDAIILKRKVESNPPLFNLISILNLIEANLRLSSSPSNNKKESNDKEDYIYKKTSMIFSKVVKVDIDINNLFKLSSGNATIPRSDDIASYNSQPSYNAELDLNKNIEEVLNSNLDVEMGNNSIDEIDIQEKNIEINNSVKEETPESILVSYRKSKTEESRINTNNTSHVDTPKSSQEVVEENKNIHHKENTKNRGYIFHNLSVDVDSVGD